MHTPGGICITKKCHNSGDVVMALQEHNNAVFTATNTALTPRELIQKLTSVCLNSSWNSTSTDFVNAFMAHVAQHNDHCPDPGAELPDVQVLQCLKGALMEVPQFKHISDWEVENQVMPSAPPCTLAQCLHIAHHAAITLDDEHQKGKHYHTANATTFGYVSDDDSADGQEFAAEFMANFMQKSSSDQS